ncbi:uncharacterized mitochondrial protein-like protein [Tanacetum coccineum]
MHEFEKMMHKKFQMSSMGELTFFLGLQVKQKEDGIFISQDKYVTEILKKFSFTNVKTASTPMETQKPLLTNEDGEEVDIYLYRSMIGSLMYLISSRPDIMFAVCACARYQVNPKVSHLHAVKRIFRYLKGQPKLGLWYPKDSPFDLVAYTDSDYARASMDRKSTTGGYQFLGSRLISRLWLLIPQQRLIDFLNANPISYALTVNPTIYTSCIEQFWSTVKAKTVNGEVQLQALVDGKKIVITEEIFNYKMLKKKRKPRKPKKKDTQPSGPTTNVADEVDNVENVSKHSNNPLLNGEDNIQLKELMDFCTKLQQRVLDLENTKTAQAQEITSLKLRVKKLEKKGGSRTHKLKRLYKVGLSKRVESSDEASLGDQEDASKQGRIADIDADEDITLVNVHDTDMFRVNDLDGDEVFIEKEVHVEEVSFVGTATTVSAVIVTKIDITLAQELAELKSAKPKATTTAATTITAASTRLKAKGLVIDDQEQAPTPTPIVSSPQSSQVKVHNKGKGIMVEESLKMKKKVQINFDQQEAIRLQAEFNEEERLAREKDEANIALTEESNDI